MEQYNELIALLEGAKEDAVKFYVKSNKAAGKRLRKVLQDVKVKAQIMRLDISKANKQ